MAAPRPKTVSFLSGWKAIANYLGKGVRTVQRYERELGLPIRRPAGKPMGSVIATKAELDGWVNASPIRQTFLLPSPKVESAAVLAEFRGNIQQLHRLRLESAVLREDLHRAFALLRENLRCLPLLNQEPERGLTNRGLADVLAFDPTRRKAN